MPLDNTATIEDLVAAVNAIEDELGIEPMGVYADIRVRLDIIEARINNPLAPSPNTEDPFLVGNSGVTISTGNGEPTENRVDGSLYLRRDGYDTHGVYIRLGGLWREVMSAGGGVGSFGGDLAAITGSTQSVIGIRGKSVSATAPTDKQILSYNGTGLAWEPTTSKIQILNIPFETSSDLLLTDDQANADLLIITGGSDGGIGVMFPGGFTRPIGDSITIINGTQVTYVLTEPDGGGIQSIPSWGIWEGSWDLGGGFLSHTYTPIIANGSVDQIIRGDGSVSSTVPTAALPAPAANTKGGVALPASSTGLFYKDDGTWSTISSSTISTGAFSSRPAAGNANTLYIDSDHGLMYFDDGYNWRPIINGKLGNEPTATTATVFPAFGTWTEGTISGSSAQTFYTTDTNTENLGVFFKGTVSGASWTIEATLSMDAFRYTVPTTLGGGQEIMSNAGGGQYPGVAIVIDDGSFASSGGATPHAFAFTSIFSVNGGNYGFNMGQWNNAISRPAYKDMLTFWAYTGGIFRMRIRYDSSKYYCDLLMDNFHGWREMGQVPASTLPSPARYGIGLQPWGGVVGATVYSLKKS